MSSRSWQKWLTSWTLKSTRCRTSGRVGRTSAWPTVHLGGLPRTYTTSRWCHPQSPKIMGLKGIHSPEALKCITGLSFCPWCRKEGQNEGTMLNHLHTRHYCLRLICKQCLLYLMTSFDAMWHHAQGSQSTCVHDGKPDEESDRSS